MPTDMPHIDQQAIYQPSCRASSIRHAWWSYRRHTSFSSSASPISTHVGRHADRYGSMLVMPVATDIGMLPGKKCSKAPKIQRLVTPLTLQRKRARIAEKKKRIAKSKADAAEYQKLLASRLKEQRDRRSESLAKRRSRMSSISKPSASA